MKKCLMGTHGYISEIRDPGEEYEIYNGPDATIQWVDAPDNVTLDWTLEWSPSAGQMVWCEREAPHTDNMMARKVAYGDIGEQLDMIFHELEDTGTLSINGPWASHVASVKASIDPPPPPPPKMTLEEAMALAEVEEPSTEKPCKMSSEDLPCWVRYPGWWGYQAPEE